MLRTFAGFMPPLLTALALLPSAAGAQTRTYIRTPFRQTGVAERQRSWPLGHLVEYSTDITVLQVTAVDKGKGTIMFKPVAALKGKAPAELLLHTFGDKLPAHERTRFLAWAQAGRTAISFRAEHDWNICVGNAWYRVNAENAAEEPFERLTEAYVGSTDRLRECVVAMLVGKEDVVTATIPAECDLIPAGPAPHDWLRGQKGHVWRLRATTKIAYRDREEPVDETDELFAHGVDKELVPKLIVALRDPDPFARCEASEDLGLVGPPARSALPALRLSLEDKDPHVRAYAALALARIDRDDKQAVPVLLAALKEKDASVRTAAAEALAELAPRTRSAALALTKALRDDADEKVRASAAFALGCVAVEAPDSEVGHADVVAALAKTVRGDEAGEVRWWAARALRRFGPDAKAAIPELKAELKGEKYARRAALDALAHMGPVAVPALCEALKGVKTADLRCDIMWRLGNMGPAAREAVSTLRELLEGDTYQDRSAAAVALLRIAGKFEAKAVAKTLGELAVLGVLPSGNAIAEVLTELGPDAKVLLPALLAGSKEHGVSRDALWLIGRLGPDARDVLPSVKGLVGEGGAGADVAYALWRLGEKREAVNGLLKRWDNPTEEDRKHDMACTLADFGPDAAEAVSRLKKELRNKPQNNRERYLRACLALALWRVQKPTEAGGVVIDPRQEALDVLVAMLRDREPVEALSALEDIGPEARAAVPGIVKAMKDDWWTTRAYAARALGRVGGKTRDVTDALQAALKDRNSEVRAEAAVALTRIDRKSAPVAVMVEAIAKRPSLLRVVGDTLIDLGPDAKPAMPTLLRLVRDEDDEERLEAARLLLRINPEAAKKAGIQ
jgi:HEAT repeat protein